MISVPVEILWCGNSRGHGNNGSDGWSFPRAVERQLRTLTEGKRVLQQFGGLAKWGIRLDIDPSTRPHVIGDAWIPPFRQNAFDVTILDPPYWRINQQEKTALLHAAAYVAREYVIWFHTIWLAGDARVCKLERGWLVRVGDTCHVRCLQLFRTLPQKRTPWIHFARGPAMKYNRWTNGQLPLPRTHGR
jgi:hypothetical protein